MRLGFDLDEVVINLSERIEEFIGTNFGVEWDSQCFINYDIKDCVFHHDTDLNNRIIDAVLESFIDPEFMSNANPIENSREVLQKLKRGGHELFFITARPKHLQPATFKWLRRNDIPFDNVDVIGKVEEKGVYGRLRRLDMYVDDLEGQLESMWRHKKRWRKGLLLFSRPWNIEKMDGSKFTRVLNWEEILRHVGIQNR